VIADRPQTIVWAFTLSSRTSIWRFMAIWPSVETLFSITPLYRVTLPEGAARIASYIEQVEAMAGRCRLTHRHPSSKHLDSWS
jgi:hypothetical protein